ncbi:MAG: hypothetical protein U1F87_08760 [Kiritimatiellia bacterium]
MQLILPESASEHITLPGGRAFDITFHLPSTHYPVLFLKINMEGSLKEQTRQSGRRSIGSHRHRAGAPARRDPGRTCVADALIRSLPEISTAAVPRSPILYHQFFTDCDSRV